MRVDANLHGIDSEVRIAQSHPGADSNISATHDDALPTSQAWAAVGLVDEANDGYYVRAHDELTDSATGARSGHLNVNIRAPTERVLRLYFETNALSTG